jgi:hypothetical protein
LTVPRQGPTSRTGRRPHRGDAVVPRQLNGIPHQPRPRTDQDRHASAGPRLRPGASPGLGGHGWRERVTTGSPAFTRSRAPAAWNGYTERT